MKERLSMHDFCSVIWESIGPDAIFPGHHGMPGIVEQFIVAAKIYDAIIENNDDAKLGALIRAYAKPYLTQVFPAIGIDRERVEKIKADMALIQKTNDEHKE